jgi:hypothetical protein
MNLACPARWHGAKFSVLTARTFITESRRRWSDNLRNHGITTIFTLVASDRSEMQQFFAQAGFVPGKICITKKVLAA